MVIICDQVLLVIIKTFKTNNILWSLHLFNQTDQTWPGMSHCPIPHTHTHTKHTEQSLLEGIMHR